MYFALDTLVFGSVQWPEKTQKTLHLGILIKIHIFELYKLQVKVFKLVNINSMTVGGKGFVLKQDRIVS